MKNKNSIFWIIILVFAISSHAQDSSKILIADGTKILLGRDYLGERTALILEKTKIGKINLPNNSGQATECKEPFSISDAAGGFFTTNKFKSSVYLYTVCDEFSNQKYQGIIVLTNSDEAEVLAHYAYQFSGDVKLAAISDLNGNSLDELAIFSEQKTGKYNRKSVRIIELLPKEIHKFGSFEIQKPDNILLASKIYAEKQVAPIFYEEKLKTDAKNWRIIQPLQLVNLDEDTTDYQKSLWSFGIADLAFWTLILQAILFILLLPVTLYEIIKTIANPAKYEKKNNEKENLNSEPDLPKLKPLNCPNCGAGVPLRDENMSCPNCRTTFPVPQEYQEVRLFRNEAAAKLKSATSYWNWATVLTSKWISRGIFFLAIWLIASPVIVGFAGNEGNMAFYWNSVGVKSFGLAALAWLFWLITLFITAGMISPRARKSLPTLEQTENVGSAENAQCSQCGGAIQYAKSDVAAVCGYCGVETYRAKIAWQMRNAINEVRQKASFSLTEAVTAFQQAVEDIVYTPIVLMFLLVILPLLLYGVFYVLSLTGLLEWI